MTIIESNDLQLYTYFSSETMMNTYIVWHKDKKEALLVDPVVLDTGLFELIQGNNLEITAVLITHGHEKEFKAVKTLPKIFPNVSIYGGSDSIYNLKMENIRDVPRISAAGFSIDPIFLPGHHSDTIVYLINEILFTGDTLSAGNLVFADGSYGRALLCHCIHETLFALTDHSLILPLYGPPSTIGIERETNFVLQEVCG